jgi:hypothetical protein
MKLWIAVFFTTDASTRFDDEGFLVRAPDLSECARAAEQHIRDLRGLLADDFEPWVGAAYELPQTAPGEDARVLYGPFSLLGTPGGQDAIHWRRDEGDPFWIDVDALRKQKPLDDCIYDDPRGWPLTAPQDCESAGKLARGTGEG